VSIRPRSAHRARTERGVVAGESKRALGARCRERQVLSKCPRVASDRLAALEPKDVRGICAPPVGGGGGRGRSHVLRGGDPRQVAAAFIGPCSEVPPRCGGSLWGAFIWSVRLRGCIRGLGRRVGSHRSAIGPSGLVHVKRHSRQPAGASAHRRPSEISPQISSCRPRQHTLVGRLETFDRKPRPGSQRWSGFSGRAPGGTFPGGPLARESPATGPEHDGVQFGVRSERNSPQLSATQPAWSQAKRTQRPRNRAAGVEQTIVCFPCIEPSTALPVAGRSMVLSRGPSAVSLEQPYGVLAGGSLRQRRAALARDAITIEAQSKHVAHCLICARRGQILQPQLRVWERMHAQHHHRSFRGCRRPRRPARIGHQF
jgi:hypothetical protein